MTDHYVVGLGEVGTALTEVLDCEGRDILPTEIKTRILHIAFSWSDHFVYEVNRAIFYHSPRFVVVHSTVPVGTCDPHGWVHSPVRGRHPDLTESLTTFTKHFGGPRSPEAAAFWPGNSLCHDRAATTEAGKLWELAQFGIQVRINQAIYEWCEESDLPPHDVYNLFAATYNDGYEALDQIEFIRPILEYIPGPIGGHCVVEGSKLLDHPLIDLI